MVGQVVTGQPMHKHIQPVAVFFEPGNDAVERRTVKCQLATPARVRPHLAFMHTPHSYSEKCAGLFAQGTRLLNGAGPEVHMGVVAGIKIFGALDHGGTEGEEREGKMKKGRTNHAFDEASGILQKRQGR